MKIFIGTNYEGAPTGVLLADSIEKAHIAWAGMKDTPHHIEEIDPSSNNLGIHGVVFLLTSVEEEVLIDRKFTKIRKWKRGL